MKFPTICKCTYCNRTLGNFTLETFIKNFKGTDKNGKRKLFCDEKCYRSYIKQFEVEVYNHTPIYGIEANGEVRYLSYWASCYYFKTIEDCRKRISSNRMVSSLCCFMLGTDNSLGI